MFRSVAQKLSCLRTVVCGLILSVNWPCYAADHNSTIQSFQIDSRSCVFFTMNGVGVADAAVSSSAWFALPKSSSNFAELYAMLLSAKLANRQIAVQTDGTASCGYATLVFVQMN